MARSQTDKSMVKRMKIAAAISVIRNKPDNLTGKQYAELLFTQYKKSQLNWKDRYKELTDEVLHLKQELIFSEIDKEPVSDFRNRRDAEQGMESIFPTPPSSSEEPKLHSRSDQIASLKRDEMFLQCCINVRAMNQYKEIHHKLEPVETRTICHCVKIIEQNLTSTDAGILLRTALLCMEALKELVLKIGEPLPAEIEKSLMDLIVSLVVRIQKNKDICEGEVKELCVSLLLELGKCPHLSFLVVNQVMRCVETLSEHLRSICLEKLQFSKLDPDLFSNTFFLLDLLKRCVEHTTRSSSNQKTLDFLVTVHDRLEDCLLHVMDKFPLFAHAVWRITSLINTVKVKCSS